METKYKTLIALVVLGIGLGINQTSNAMQDKVFFKMGGKLVDLSQPHQGRRLGKKRPGGKNKKQLTQQKKTSSLTQKLLDCPLQKYLELPQETSLQTYAAHLNQLLDVVEQQSRWLNDVREYEDNRTKHCKAFIGQIRLSIDTDHLKPTTPEDRSFFIRYAAVQKRLHEASETGGKKATVAVLSQIDRSFLKDSQLSSSPFIKSCGKKLLLLEECGYLVQKFDLYERTLTLENIPVTKYGNLQTCLLKDSVLKKVGNDLFLNAPLLDNMLALEFDHKKSRATTLSDEKRVGELEKFEPRYAKLRDDARNTLVKAACFADEIKREIQRVHELLPKKTIPQKTRKKEIIPPKEQTQKSDLPQESKPNSTTNPVKEEPGLPKLPRFYAQPIEFPYEYTDRVKRWLGDKDDVRKAIEEWQGKYNNNLEYTKDEKKDLIWFHSFPKEVDQYLSLAIACPWTGEGARKGDMSYSIPAEITDLNTGDTYGVIFTFGVNNKTYKCFHRCISLHPLKELEDLVKNRRYQIKKEAKTLTKEERRNAFYGTTPKSELKMPEKTIESDLTIIIPDQKNNRIITLFKAVRKENNK